MSDAASSGRSTSRKRWSAAVLVAIGTICLFLFCPYFFPTVRINTQLGQSSYNMKQIALAIQNYHEVYGQLPPAAASDKDGRLLYSWRVALLPFLERDDLYRQFRLDEPWDSPHNEPLTRTTPRCYVSARGGDDPDGLTRYQVLVGPGTAFERPGLTWEDFPDGREYTLLVVEAGEPVPWAKPVDLGYDPAGPLPSLGAGSPSRSTSSVARSLVARVSLLALRMVQRDSCAARLMSRPSGRPLLETVASGLACPSWSDRRSLLAAEQHRALPEQHFQFLDLER